MVQVNQKAQRKADRERDQERQGATSLEKTMPGHPDYRNPLHRGPGDVNDTHASPSGPRGEGMVDEHGRPLAHSADPQALADKDRDSRNDKVGNTPSPGRSTDGRKDVGEKGPTPAEKGKTGESK